MTIEQIKQFFEDDKFAMNMGIRILEAADGESLCTFDITPAHYNAGNTVQGGAIFTLADFAFAVAANCGGQHTVSQSCNVSFIKQGKGKTLFARAKKISSGRQTCHYEVRVTNEDEILIAHMVVNGFIVGAW